VRDLHDAGVPLLVGTDAGGTIGHGRIADEALAMVEAGVPAPAVVAAASWRTRAWLGVPGLGEGESADLVVYDADPRTDVRVLAAPRAVVLRGRRVA
jgi:imidazolonepropionase-like amidohydrolase